MATYVGDMPAYGHMYGADAEVTQYDERGVRTLGATIGFGPVVFQVFGTTLPGVHDEARTRVGSSPVVPLCPYQQSFTWSPVAGLDDTGLTAFSEAIYGEIARGSGGPESAARSEIAGSSGFDAVLSADDGKPRRSLGDLILRR